MKRLLLILFVIFSLCVCCGIGANASTPGNTSPSSQDQKQATPPPPPVTVLGSNLSAFEARFGQADQSVDFNDNPIPNAYEFHPGFFQPAYSVEVVNGRVSWINISDLYNSDKGQCYTFMPHDAKLIVSHPGGDPYTEVYISVELAQEFPAKLFLDSGDTKAYQDPFPTTPGTFAIQFVPSINGSNFGAYCQLYLGR